MRFYTLAEKRPLAGQVILAKLNSDTTNTWHTLNCASCCGDAIYFIDISNEYRTMDVEVSDIICWKPVVDRIEAEEQLTSNFHFLYFSRDKFGRKIKTKRGARK